jgi:CelD/BcsL family acetyltransferase involved in cellulose biosynthesis
LCSAVDVRVNIVEGMSGVAAEIEASRQLMVDLQAPVTAQATWLMTALECLPFGRPWAVVIRSETGERTGLALLTTTRQKGHSSVALLGDAVSDHARLLAVDTATAEALAEGITKDLHRTRGPWRLHIEQIPHGDPTLEFLAASLQHTQLREGPVCPLTRFNSSRSLTNYLSKNARGMAKQGRNRLSREDPDWRIVRTRDPAEISALLPLVVAMHRRRDHALGRRSDLDSEHRMAFYTSVTRALAVEGKVELATLRIRDVVAAYLLVLVDGDVWRFWDNRIDVDHNHLHAGRVLDTTVLAAALEDTSVTAVDWMRGQMQHKKQASNDEQRTDELTAWSSPLLKTAEDAAVRGHALLRAAVPADLRRRIRGRSRGVALPTG